MSCAKSLERLLQGGGYPTEVRRFDEGTQPTTAISREGVGGMYPNHTLLFFPQTLEHAIHWLNTGKSQRVREPTQVVHTSQPTGHSVGRRKVESKLKEANNSFQHNIQNSDSIFPHLILSFGHTDFGYFAIINSSIIREFCPHFLCLTYYLKLCFTNETNVHDTTIGWLCCMPSNCFLRV